MKRLRDQPPVLPKTGTSTRMKTLPHINISSLEYHRSTLPEAMRVPTIQKGVAYPETENRKCVYTYEDKYTFARILNSDSLVFDSHFESGNLQSAYRVLFDADEGGGNLVNDRNHTAVYDLYMHNDLNATGHTQWFYFSVSNTRAGQEVTFCLRNFAKSSSLFNQGMRPLLYSHKSDNGWERCGTDISYYTCGSSVHKADKSKKNGVRQATLYTLAFSIVFEYTNDVCYFAYCYPYTYSDLQNYLYKMQLHLDNTRNSQILKREVLCKTLAGNDCDLLTITAPATSAEELNSRPGIVITARVHPGETNASWMMQGALDHLLSDTLEAAQLRNCFVFKIIPMLNPDGVVNGNYRTSLSGSDLNRHWGKPDKLLHPTIYHAKYMMSKLRKIRTVGAVVDLHGHSHKEGIFLYGCIPEKRLLKTNASPAPTPRVPPSDREFQFPIINSTSNNGEPAEAGASQNQTLPLPSPVANSTSTNHSHLVIQALNDDRHNLSTNPINGESMPAVPNTGIGIGIAGSMSQKESIRPLDRTLTSLALWGNGIASSNGGSHNTTPLEATHRSNGSSSNINAPTTTTTTAAGISRNLSLDTVALINAMSSNNASNNASNNGNNGNSGGMLSSRFDRSHSRQNITIPLSISIPPPKDVLSWRIRFLPRLLSVLNSSVDINGCSFLEIYPCCTSTPKSIVLKDSSQLPASTASSMIGSSEGCISPHDDFTETLATLRSELNYWKKYFNVEDSGFGVHLLSPAGLKEMTVPDDSAAAGANNANNNDDNSDASSAEGDSHKRTTSTTTTAAATSTVNTVTPSSANSTAATNGNSNSLPVAASIAGGGAGGGSTSTSTTAPALQTTDSGSSKDILQSDARNKKNKRIKGRKTTEDLFVIIDECKEENSEEKWAPFNDQNNNRQGRNESNKESTVKRATQPRSIALNITPLVPSSSAARKANSNSGSLFPSPSYSSNYVSSSDARYKLSNSNENTTGPPGAQTNTRPGSGVTHRSKSRAILSTSSSNTESQQPPLIPTTTTTTTTAVSTTTRNKMNDISNSNNGNNNNNNNNAQSLAKLLRKKSQNSVGSNEGVAVAVAVAAVLERENKGTKSSFSNNKGSENNLGQYFGINDLPKKNNRENEIGEKTVYKYLPSGRVVLADDSELTAPTAVAASQLQGVATTDSELPSHKLFQKMSSKATSQSSSTQQSSSAKLSRGSYTPADTTGYMMKVTRPKSGASGAHIPMPLLTQQQLLQAALDSYNHTTASATANGYSDNAAAAGGRQGSAVRGGGAGGVTDTAEGGRSRSRSRGPGGKGSRSAMNWGFYPPAVVPAVVPAVLLQNAANNAAVAAADRRDNYHRDTMSVRSSPPHRDSFPAAAHFPKSPQPSLPLSSTPTRPKSATYFYGGGRAKNAYDRWNVKIVDDQSDRETNIGNTNTQQRKTSLNNSELSKPRLSFADGGGGDIRRSLTGQRSDHDVGSAMASASATATAALEDDELGIALDDDGDDIGDPEGIMNKSLLRSLRAVLLGQDDKRISPSPATRKTSNRNINTSSTTDTNKNNSDKNRSNSQAKIKYRYHSYGNSTTNSNVNHKNIKI